ncbi:MAG: portal protein, partial [Acidobacteria bacterium]|nr:portal protein [Acidobacteriota bacterium]
MPTAKELISRYNRMKADRGNWESVWQDIADNLLGRRDFITERTPGEQRQQRIFDTTAQLAAELLSAALHALLTNPSSQWFALRPANEALLDDPEVMQWSYEAERVMRDVFESPKTGFATAMHEVYVDMPVFGTAGLWVEDRADGNIIFSARPLGELFLAENSSGRVDTVFRRFSFTARQALEEFGAGAPTQAIEAMRKDKPDEKVDFLHALMPNRNAGKPWGSYFVAIQDQKIVSEGGFFSMPYMTPRWSKDVGEIYGRGPGWASLPDAKMCNRIKESMLKAQQLAVEPPRLVPDDGCVFPLRLTPGAQNKYRAELFRTDPIQTLGYEGNYPIGEKALEMVQEAIRMAFHSELLPLFQKPYMTATEVVELANQAQ